MFSIRFKHIYWSVSVNQGVSQQNILRDNSKHATQPSGGLCCVALKWRSQQALHSYSICLPTGLVVMQSFATSEKRWKKRIKISKDTNHPAIKATCNGLGSLCVISTWNVMMEKVKVNLNKAFRYYPTMIRASIPRLGESQLNLECGAVKCLIVVTCITYCQWCQCK